MKHGFTAFRWIGMASAALCVAPLLASAQTTPTDDLASFGERMVGTWEGVGSRHVFEWGVGERVLKSRSYFAEGDDWVLVSEGWWYWDPAAGAVRGKTIAIDMPGELFEYTTRLHDDEVVHDLVLHGEMGGAFVERWVFSGGGYSWALEQDGQRLMGGEYARVR